MKSILTDEKCCFLCGSNQWIEKHHIFTGALRSKSEKYGLVVPLCHYCHNEPPNGVHHDREAADSLKAEAQQVAMAVYGWTKEDFVKEFGRNYL